MIRKSIPLLIAAGLVSPLLTAATPIKIADADIPNADPKVLVNHITKLEGTVPAQWRVIWTGDASTEATISWSTAEEGSKHCKGLRYTES